MIKIIVPVSGGKDSQVCLALAVDQVGADHVLGVHQRTNFDHSLTYAHMDYMRERYGAQIVDVQNPDYYDVPDVMLKNVVIPSARARMCTKRLKLDPWIAFLRERKDKDAIVVWLGMRGAESQARSERYGELSPADEFPLSDLLGHQTGIKSVRHVRCRLPIVDWSTSTVFEFLRERGDKINPLYERGHLRVGCYPCALAGKRDFVLAARDPEGRKNIEAMRVAIVQFRKKRPEVDVPFHDLDAILAAKLDDPFGIYDDDNQGGCAWCAV